MEWYRLGKTKVLREKPVPVPLFPLQILHGLAWDWIQPDVLRGWWLTTQAAVQPQCWSNLMNQFKTVTTTFSFTLLPTTCKYSKLKIWSVLTAAVTPPAIAKFRLCLLACSYRAYSFLPTHTGIPEIKKNQSCWRKRSLGRPSDQKISLTCKEIQK